MKVIDAQQAHIAWKVTQHLDGAETLALTTCNQYKLSSSQQS